MPYHCLSSISNLFNRCLGHSNSQDKIYQDIQPSSLDSENKKSNNPTCEPANTKAVDLMPTPSTTSNDSTANVNNDQKKVNSNVSPPPSENGPRENKSPKSDYETQKDPLSTSCVMMSGITKNDSESSNDSIPDIKPSSGEKKQYDRQAPPIPPSNMSVDKIIIDTFYLSKISKLEISPNTGAPPHQKIKPTVPLFPTTPEYKNKITTDDILRVLKETDQIFFENQNTFEQKLTELKLFIPWHNHLIQMDSLPPLLKYVSWVIFYESIVALTRYNLNDTEGDRFKYINKKNLNELFRVLDDHPTMREVKSGGQQKKKEKLSNRKFLKFIYNQDLNPEEPNFKQYFVEQSKEKKITNYLSRVYESFSDDLNTIAESYSDDSKSVNESFDDDLKTVERFDGTPNKDKKEKIKIYLDSEACQFTLMVLKKPSLNSNNAVYNEIINLQNTLKKKEEKEKATKIYVMEWFRKQQQDDDRKYAHTGFLC